MKKKQTQKPNKTGSLLEGPKGYEPVKAGFHFFSDLFGAFRGSGYCPGGGQKKKGFRDLKNPVFREKNQKEKGLPGGETIGAEAGKGPAIWFWFGFRENQAGT